MDGGASGSGGGSGSGGSTGSDGAAGAPSDDGGAGGAGGAAPSKDAAPPTDATADTPAGAVSATFDFAKGDNGWTADFSDYSVGQTRAFMELDAKIAALPAELGTSATGFMIQGNNHSDDLFMFFARALGPADGVVANRSYQAAFKVVFASNAEEGCAGIGGAPDALWLKVGATTIQPKVVVQSNMYVMNVDKGAQSNSGPAASVVSTVGNGKPCVDRTSPYVSLTRSHVHPGKVTADATGTLWLLVGTDSGFEGLSRLYYQRIEVTLTPVP